MIEGTKVLEKIEKFFEKWKDNEKMNDMDRRKLSMDIKMEITKWIGWWKNHTEDPKLVERVQEPAMYPVWKAMPEIPKEFKYIDELKPVFEEANKQCVEVWRMDDWFDGFIDKVKNGWNFRRKTLG